MKTCKFKSSCALYRDMELIMPITLEFIKTEYCEGNYRKCARYIVCKAEGPQYVSRSLFPGDTREASNILDGLRRSGVHA